jgi:hypothetical protein
VFCDLQASSNSLKPRKFRYRIYVINVEVETGGMPKVCCDEGFSMRATAEGFGVGLTLARVDKPLKEEAVGC